MCGYKASATKEEGSDRGALEERSVLIDKAEVVFDLAGYVIRKKLGVEPLTL